MFFGTTCFMDTHQLQKSRNLTCVGSQFGADKCREKGFQNSTSGL